MATTAGLQQTGNAADVLLWHVVHDRENMLSQPCDLTLMLQTANLVIKNARESVPVPLGSSSALGCQCYYDECMGKIITFPGSLVTF